MHGNLIKYFSNFSNSMALSNLIIFLLLLSSIINEISSFRLQGVGVKGQLLCKGIPAAHLNVGLFDVDRNPGDPDDLLDNGISDRNGNFVLDGTTRELFSIEPELRIIHDCDDSLKTCHRLTIIKIAEDYIHHGKVEKFFDIGMLDLSDIPQTETISEQRFCQDEF